MKILTDKNKEKSFKSGDALVYTWQFLTRCTETRLVLSLWATRGPCLYRDIIFRVRFEGHVAVFNHIGLHMDVTGHHSLAVA